MNNKYLGLFSSFTLLVATLLMAACGEQAGKQGQNNAQAIDRTRLENINKYLTEKDKDIIESHIRRQGWKMQLSPDGYFFEIFKEGSLPKAVDGNEVVYEYAVSLLNGTACYKSIEPKSFLLGRSEEISGLHLAITHLGAGGKAKFIFPPQLAYGLQGDMNKIPPRSIVVYDIDVIDVIDIK